MGKEGFLEELTLKLTPEAQVRLKGESSRQKKPQAKVHKVATIACWRHETRGGEVGLKKLAMTGGWKRSYAVL